MKEFMIDIAKHAGKIALDFLGKAEIKEKKPKDLVTEADVAVEKYLVSKIKEKFSDHNIVGEEDEYKKSDSEYYWYIDPIDGTANYAHGDIHFAISIALKNRKEIVNAVVYIPMLDEMFYAEKGQGAFLNGKKIHVSKISDLKSSYIQVGLSPHDHAIDDSVLFYKEVSLKVSRAKDMGFCAGQLAFLACGRADGFMKFSQHPWDLAAGLLLVKEAGGKITDVHGNEFEVGDKNARHDVVASNSILHDKLLDIMKSDKIKELDLKKNWF